MARGFSRSAGCGVFLDRGLNLWPPRWQVDCQPLDQKSPSCDLVVALSYLSEELCLPQVLKGQVGLLSDGWRGVSRSERLKPALRRIGIAMHRYSCLENPMDREAWWVTVHRVAKNWTQLK